MRRTLYLLQQQTVVVTLLSPSPYASRRMLHRLQRWTLQTQQPMVRRGAAANDALDQTLVSNAMLRIVRPKLKLDSVALPLGSTYCPRVVLHWLSLDLGDLDRNNTYSDMQLLAIQRLTWHEDLLQETRNQLVEKLRMRDTSLFKTVQTLGLALAGRLTTRHLVPRQLEYLPLLELDEPNDGYDVDPSISWKNGELKEIVIPTYASDTYADKKTLFTTLRDSPHLTRPVPGVYKLLASRVCIRPLPMAKEDRKVPPPSLIFHWDDLEEAGLRNVDDDTTHAVKIGYTGRTGRGQLMLLDDKKDNLMSSGVDIRLCSATQSSPVFAESQESLLASSLSELQSKHVLTNHLPGDATVQRESDPNINKMDCWVEFRANIRNPQGFLPRHELASRPRTAKAPDLPFE